MKILIISDIHGNAYALKNVLRSHRTVDCVILLGDGLDVAEEILQSFSDLKIFAVKGNCDMRPFFLGEPLKKLDFLTLEGKKIVFTHGDLYGVKYGDGGLIRLAKEHCADVVHYGHTHVPRESYVDGIYYFNPGALSGYNSSYGLLTIDGNNLLFSHGKIV